MAHPVPPCGAHYSFARGVRTSVCQESKYTLQRFGRGLVCLLKFTRLVYLFSPYIKREILNALNCLMGKSALPNTRHVSSMIPSARPIVPPIAIIIFNRHLFCFAIFWNVGTDGNMCKNNDHYRPGLWVGRVDQFSSFALNNTVSFISRPEKNSLYLNWQIQSTRKFLTYPFSKYKDSKKTVKARHNFLRNLCYSSTSKSSIE